MEIRLAKHSGFCFGVKKALSKTKKLLESREGLVYSIGDLVHNPQVISELKDKGLRIVGGLRHIKKGTIIVRAHGFPPSLIGQVKAKGLKLMDTTCPFVKKAQNILKSLTGKGYTIIVLGDKNHPEVKSLLGFAQNNVLVVEGPQDLKRLELERTKKVGLLVQTTRSREDFQAVASELIKNGHFEVRIFNTICEAVVSRQKEARRLAKEVDLMVVVGGKMSANTKTLAEICKTAGAKTFHIEKPDEIEASWLKHVMTVGVICGTSTPEWVQDEVLKEIERKGAIDE